jgi:hypothetical protein
MKTNFYEKKITKLIPLLLSILLALLIFYFSLNTDIWASFWGKLKIPPNHVPFSDYKAHLLFLQCQELGIDINSQECTLIPKGNSQINTHPSIWINLFNILNLKNPLIYNISIITLFTFYFYVLSELLKKFKNKLSKAILVILLFSTTNFILIERLATDIIIFLLVYFILNIKNKIFQSLLIFLGFLLKVYPIFLISLLIEKKKYLFIFISIITIFIVLFHIEEMQLINKNIIEMALPIAYGSRTMLKAFYHLSLEYDLFVNDKNINLLRYIVVLAFFAYSFFLVLVGYNNQYSLNIKSKLDKYFLAGASIYVGTFIIGANADYRLIFLIFTVPYIINLEFRFIKYLLLFCYIFSFNSFYFLSGDFLSMIFLVSSLFIFLCKFIILSLLTILIGIEIKKINFFKF